MAESKKVQAVRLTARVWRILEVAGEDGTTTLKEALYDLLRPHGWQGRGIGPACFLCDAFGCAAPELRRCPLMDATGGVICIDPGGLYYDWLGDVGGRAKAAAKIVTVCEEWLGKHGGVKGTPTPPARDAEIAAG